MIAHILSIEAWECDRMLAENANLSRMMARCARGASELGPTEVKIGAFVMKCVEKSRAHLLLKNSKVGYVSSTKKCIEKNNHSSCRSSSNLPECSSHRFL